MPTTSSPQQANPDQGHDIEALYRIGNQYKAYRILAGDWVFARQEAGNAPGAEAGQGTAQSLSAGAVSSVPETGVKNGGGENIQTGTQMHELTNDSAITPASGEQNTVKPPEVDTASVNGNGQQIEQQGADKRDRNNESEAEENPEEADATPKTILRAILQQRKFNSGKEWGAADEAEFKTTEAKLDHALADAAKKKGAPLTAEEEQNIVEGYAAKVLNKNTKGEGGSDEVVDEDAEIQVPRYIVRMRRYKVLEFGKMGAVRAILLHRTGADTADSTLSQYKSGSRPYGAHFLVTEDGKIIQTASLTKKTQHVGDIRPKCDADNTCPADEKKMYYDRNKSFSSRKHLVSQYEVMNKNYPDRYTTSSESIGIEIVGSDYSNATQAQKDAVKALVELLQKKYGLEDRDVYSHGRISYKDEAEGANLGY